MWEREFDGNLGLLVQEGDFSDPFADAERLEQQKRKAEQAVHTKQGPLPAGSAPAAPPGQPQPAPTSAPQLGFGQTAPASVPAGKFVQYAYWCQDCMTAVLLHAGLAEAKPCTSLLHSSKQASGLEYMSTKPQPGLLFLTCTRAECHTLINLVLVSHCQRSRIPAAHLFNCDRVLHDTLGSTEWC